MIPSTHSRTPIHRLPTELLLRILSLSLPPPSSPSRATQLRHLPLVSRLWTAPAQSLLWAHITLTSLAATEALLASEMVGMYVVRALVVRIESEPGVREHMGELLRRCGEGMRELQLIEHGISPSAPPFDPSALAQPSLSST